MEHAKFKRELKALLKELSPRDARLIFWDMLRNAVAGEDTEPGDRTNFVDLYRWHIRLYKLLKRH